MRRRTWAAQGARRNNGVLHRARRRKVLRLLQAGIDCVTRDLCALLESVMKPAAAQKGTRNAKRLAASQADLKAGRLRRGTAAQLMREIRRTG